MVLAAGPARSMEPDDGGDDPGEHPAIQFEVPEVEAHPGDVVEVPFTITTDAALSVAAFSLEYESGAFAFGSPVLDADLQAIVDSNPDSHFQYSFDDQAGHVQVALVTDFLGRDAFAIQPGKRPVATLEFQVSRDAPEGRHPLSFTRKESADYESELKNSAQSSVYNSARRDGQEFDRETELDDGEDCTLSDGAILVTIIGDVSVFARGDANSDRKLDVSDPVRILGWLFLGDPELSCKDAGDANDDGKLDLSDPVMILHYLFVDASGSHLSTIPTSDPTPDELGCVRY